MSSYHAHIYCIYCILYCIWNTYFLRRTSFSLEILPLFFILIFTWNSKRSSHNLTQLVFNSFTYVSHRIQFIFIICSLQNHIEAIQKLFLFFIISFCRALTLENVNLSHSAREPTNPKLSTALFRSFLRWVSSLSSIFQFVLTKCFKPLYYEPVGNLIYYS